MLFTNVFIDKKKNLAVLGFFFFPVWLSNPQVIPMKIVGILKEGKFDRLNEFIACFHVV